MACIHSFLILPLITPASYCIHILKNLAYDMLIEIIAILVYIQCFVFLGFRTDNTIIYNQITPQLIVRKYKTKNVRNTSRKHVLYAKIVQSWSVLSLIESKLKKQSQVMQGKKTKSIVKERAFLHADAIYGFHSTLLRYKLKLWAEK